MQIKHISAGKNDLPKGLSEYVDRGTLEICLHLVVLSLSLVSILLSLVIHCSKFSSKLGIILIQRNYLKIMDDIIYHFILLLL